MSTKDYAKYTGLQAWPDAKFARVTVVACRSTSSSVHTWGDVTFVSQCVKQPEPAASTNDAEAISLFQATRRTLAYRSILRSLDIAQKHPTPTHKDSTATIAQVLNDRLTPGVKHIDINISWINNQFGRNRMASVACPSALEKVDMNTKPHGGSTLQQKFLPLVGFQFYLPPTSKHHKLLQLDELGIGTRRGSFLLDKKKFSANEAPVLSTEGNPYSKK